MVTWGKSVLTAVACGLAVAVVWVLLTLPPRSREADQPDAVVESASLVAGAFHVHTTRSDGGAPVDDVARAAGQAGLQFLIVTDHGDGTRPPDPPQYRSGVLTLDGVEISTAGGHYIAVGLPQTPYPLGGEPDTVVEDVRRLGGFGVVAHPKSPKAGLSWRDPTLAVDAIEWLNADSEWRDESRLHLLASAARYSLRPSETLASLLSRPDDALAMWDRLSGRRQTVGLAAHDAHGWVTTGTTEEGRVSSLGLGFPDYADLLRTFSLRVELDRPFTGDAEVDAEVLLDAIRAGRTFTVVDALASPAAFRFEAVGPGRTYSMGDRVPSGTTVEFRAAATAPAGTEVVLLANGRTVHTVTDEELRYQAEEPAVYRVEVRLNLGGEESPVPWIVSNPITLGDLPVGGRPELRSATARRRLMGPTRAEGGVWSVEHDPGSTAEVTIEPGRILLRYRLSDSTTGSPYAAAMRPVKGINLESFDGVVFNVTADRPVRLFVYLRAGGLAGEPGWRSSFYADTTPRRVGIAFNEFDSVQPDLYDGVDLASTDSFLLVAELVNARRGSSAVVTVRRLRLERW